MDYLDYIEGLDESVFTLLIPLGVAVGAIVVQWATNRYRRVRRQVGGTPSSCGLTGRAVAERLLTASGLSDVKIVRGIRSNHYHPWRREIHLLPHVFDGPSLAALTTAAHEVGHARQFADRILLCRLRGIFWPICWALPTLAFLLCVPLAIGIEDWSYGQMFAGVLAVSAVMVFLQLPIALPLERDASLRAGQLARDAELLDSREEKNFDRLLSAAWKTHAARETQKCIILLSIALAAAGMWWLRNLLHQPVVVLVTEYVVAPGPGIAGQALPLVHPSSILGLTVIAWVVFLAPVAVLLCGLLWLAVKWSGQRRSRSPLRRAVQRNNAATQLVKQGRLRAALGGFTRALQLDANLMVAYFNRACTHVHLCNKDEALADFDATLRLAPRFAEAMGLRGLVYLLRGETDRAGDEIERALRDVPESVTALYCRGELWLAQGNHDRAIADFTAAIDRDPNHFAALRGRGLARYFQGDFDQAIADLDRAIEICPKYALALNDRGAAQLKRGEYAHANADLRKAMRLEPKFPNPYKHLAWLQATCPQARFRSGARAVANATRALKLVEWRCVEWLVVLAAAHAEAGDFDAAVQRQTECLEQSPADATDELQEGATGVPRFVAEFVRIPIAEHTKLSEFSRIPLRARPLLAHCEEDRLRPLQEQLRLYQARQAYRDQPVGQAVEVVVT